MTTPTARDFLRRMEFTAITDAVTWSGRDANTLIAALRRAMDALDCIGANETDGIADIMDMVDEARDDINALAARGEGGT